MPERTYIHKEAKTMPGFKAFKDRVTLLIGGNVTGYKLKPFMIYRYQNPRAFKRINKRTLPVHYRANDKAWMSLAMFEDWFLDCFIPSAREYCLKKSIPFRILLILDNAPGHPPHLDDLDPDVRVIYMPPNTSSLIQPMDQGVIATFKAYYLQATFSQAIAATDCNTELTLREFWKNYNIYQSIKNIAAAWEIVSVRCMNGVWKNMLKRYVNIFKGFDEEEALDKIRERIVKLAKNLELECEVEDVEELLDIQSKELTNEDLIELEEDRVAEEERMEEEEEDDDPVRKKFTVKGLAEVFSDMNRTLAKLEGMDPNVERFAKVDRLIQDALKCYRQIYDDKKKQTVQTKISSFFKRASPIATPGPSSPRPSSPGPASPTSSSSGAWGDDP